MKNKTKALALALFVAFTGAASAQAQECKSSKIIEYDIERDGQTLQGTGSIAGGGEIEIYGNQETSTWTMVERRGDQSCVYKLGGIFFNEKDRPNDGKKTLRQAAFALHGYGNGRNEAFELMAHEGTGRWVLTRRISADEQKVVMAGGDYKEFNLPAKSPSYFVDYKPAALQ